ncbi:MAG: gliding motility-associated C-terminal domain-containing protein, partial [Bacteroidota bacterium]|nr:gliding motility-associated C-terminal domain-containing protein [Bacteroidota bacterium]
TIIKANVSGVAGPLTYKWNTTPVKTTQQITEKPNVSSTYIITVNDGTCDVIADIPVCVLTANAGPDITITQGSDTTLTVTAPCGNITAYSWAPGNYNTPAITITPTSSTTYSVTVIDSLGCFAKDNVGVCALTLKISNDTTIMAGDTAKLWTEPLCGGNYTYTWPGGGNTPNIKVNPTTTTTYIVTVTGPGGATATADVVVIVKKCNLTVNLTASDTVISVGAATIIKANVSGVAGPLTYKWNTTPVKTTQQITVKPNVSSTYIVTVNDGTCDVTADIPVCVLTANAGPDITITQGSDTTLTVTAPCGNITAYSWSSGSTQQNPKVKPTVTTTYIVIITDKTGATAIDTVIVYVSQCFVDAGPDQTICKNTCVTLKANCGLCDSKMWSTGETTDSITVCPLKTTKYYVTATLKTCTHVDSVEISISPDYLKLTPSNAVICMGDSTDIIATGIKTFLWNTKETTRIINVKPKITSTYSVTGKNQNGCVESGDIQIQVNSLPIASAGGNKTICKNSQGSLTASGGFKYLWSNSDSTQTITVSPVQTSTYIVTVSDNIGCSSTASAVITVNWVNVSAGSDTLICNGDCATLKSIVSSNDTIDQIIQIWSNGTTGPGITVCPKDTTKYTVSVIDGNNCRSSAGVIVNVRTVKAIITDTLVVCENAKKVVLPASSNIPGATYSWTGPNGFSSPPKTAEIDTVNSSGDYVVIAKAFNCSSLPETLHVKMTALPLKPVVHTDTVCEGQTLRLSIDPVANAKYIWTGPALSKPDSSNPLIIKNSKVINSGNYSASVIIENCKSDTATKTAKVLPKPIAIFAPSIDKGDIPLDVTFINSSWNASKYLWDFGDETTATVKNPVHTYTTAGSFKVFLTAMNALGCDTIAEYTFIRVDNSSILYIPNAFTPNGDLDNDLFQIKGVGINKFDGYIFDRWGVQLYEWHDIKGGWDGTYQGNVVKQDVYLYKIKAEGVNKVVYQKSGTVTLIR